MSSNRPQWICILAEHYRWQSPVRPTQDCAFQDSSGTTRLVIEVDGTITVMKDYAWDGCTPKFYAADLRFEMPEGATHRDSRLPCTYYATLVHDALYQFLGAHNIYRRIDADRCFATLLREHGFRARALYYGGLVTATDFPLKEVSDPLRFLKLLIGPILTTMAVNTSCLSQFTGPAVARTFPQ